MQARYYRLNVTRLIFRTLQSRMIDVCQNYRCLWAVVCYKINVSQNNYNNFTTICKESHFINDICSYKTYIIDHNVNICVSIEFQTYFTTYLTRQLTRSINATAWRLVGGINQVCADMNNYMLRKVK